MLLLVGRRHGEGELARHPLTAVELEQRGALLEEGLEGAELLLPELDEVLQQSGGLVAVPLRKDLQYSSTCSSRGSYGVIGGK